VVSKAAGEVIILTTIPRDGASVAGSLSTKGVIVQLSGYDAGFVKFGGAYALSDSAEQVADLDGVLKEANGHR